jgi:alpha-tubulin suppressor-like RCC1 family protein
MPDQILARVGTAAATSTWNKLTPLTFHLEVDLAKPLGALDTLQIEFMKWGMQSITLRCTGACESSSWKVDHNAVAEHLLRLMDSTPSQPRTRAGLISLYAKALISGDTTLAPFPATAPIGISRDSVHDEILLQAQKNASSLAAIVDSVEWLPTRNLDSLRALYLELISRKSLTASDSSRLFPGAPKLLRLPDLKVRNVQKDSARYQARWVVSGGSAPFTVLIDGAAAEADGSIYARTVPVSFGTNSVVVSVSDRTGAKAYDTITVVRDDGAPALARTAPADTAAVVFDSTSLVFAWNASDVSGVKSVAIGGKPATRTGTVWSVRLNMAQGPNQFVAVAEDSLGNTTSDTVKIRRLADTQGPTIAAIEGFGARQVNYDSASVPVAWMVADVGGVKSVAIAGSPASGFSGRYQAIVALKPGQNSVAIEVVDSTGNVRRDSVSVERHRAMATQVAAAGEATVILKQDGAISVWGGDLATTPQPVDMGSIVSVSAGLGHILALTTAGTVVAWGAPAHDVLKIPNQLSGVVAVAAGSTHSLALKRDGTVVGWGDTTKGECRMPYGLSDVVTIAAGYEFSVALKKDGTVWAWGDSTLKQTAVPSGIATAKSISAGFGHAVVLLGDGTIKAWGDNAKGQISVPANLPKIAQVAAGGKHTLALLADSTVVGWGDNGAGQTTVPTGLKNVVAISAGYAHSAALLKDGTIVVWGDNSAAQATVPTTLSKY